MNLNRKILILFIIVVVDSLVTVYLICTGYAIEANPIMRWYMHQTSLTWMAITKMVGSLILLYLLKNMKEANRHLDWAIPAYLFILGSAIMLQIAWLRWN